MPKDTFENKLNKLEDIVTNLESGDAPLDACINLYEKGIKLTNECLQMLKDAEQKIETITQKDNGEDNE